MIGVLTVIALLDVSGSLIIRVLTCCLDLALSLPLSGYKCIVHMSEDGRDAAKAVSPTSIKVMRCNAVLPLLIGVPFYFHNGQCWPGRPPFSFRFFLNATGSYATTDIMQVTVTITVISACFGKVATVIRQI